MGTDSAKPVSTSSAAATCFGRAICNDGGDMPEYKGELIMVHSAMPS